MAMQDENTDARHFASIPWCAEHLNRPGVVVQTAPSRFARSSTEHELFSRSLNGPNTISDFVIFYDEPPAEASVPTSTSDAAGTGKPPILELRGFLTLATGLSGHPGVCHGGIVATILDELMGFPFPLNMARGAFPHAQYMTATLNTSYLFPVPTPGTILAVVRVVRVDGRKYFLEGHVEDETGKVLARCESLYVALKPKL